MLELLSQMVSEPCFSILRTQEQLGYTVFSSIHRSRGAQGLKIVVQSDRHPNFIDKRIEVFVETMLVSNLVGISVSGKLKIRVYIYIYCDGTPLPLGRVLRFPARWRLGERFAQAKSLNCHEHSTCPVL